MRAILLFVKLNTIALFFLIGFSLVCNAQTTRKPDIIILKTNIKLEVLIQEVGEDLIKYKKLSDVDGPVFTVNKTEIASILYGNGEVESFSNASNEVFFSQDKPVKPVESNPQPIPSNKFDQEIFAYNPNQLRKAYQYYRSKSKRGLVSGIVWTVLGTVSMGVGTALLATSGYTSNNYGYNTYNDNSEAGAALLIGGLIGGATFGTIGFVKAGKNGSKATRIRRELIRRREPITFKLIPGYNVMTQSGYLGLRMNF